MYASMYVCMYVSLHTYTHTYIHYTITCVLCTYVCMYIRVYASVWLRIYCVYVFMYMCTVFMYLSLPNTFNSTSQFTAALNCLTCFSDLLYSDSDQIPAALIIIKQPPHLRQCSTHWYSNTETKRNAHSSVLLVQFGLHLCTATGNIRNS